MTVTGKPNAGDPIVEEIINPLTGKSFIPTAQFWRFLDELSEAVAFNETKDDSATLLAGVFARVADIETELRDDPFTVDSTGWTVDSTLITADWNKA